MKKVKLNGSQLSFASFDERGGVLVIEFANHTSKSFKGVPHEVFNRLCQSPNAQAFFEDRIAEEYPNERLATQTNQASRDSLNDLFGSSPDK